MARTIGARLVLNSEEMQAFIQQVNNPAHDTICRRDELFKVLDRLELIEDKDGVLAMEIDLEVFDAALDYDCVESVSESGSFESVYGVYSYADEEGVAEVSNTYSALIAA